MTFSPAAVLTMLHTPVNSAFSQHRNTSVPRTPRTQNCAQSPPLQPLPVCPTRSILPLCHLSLSKVNIPLLSLLTIRDCLQLLSWDPGAARLALDLLQRTWPCTLFYMQSPRVTLLLGDIHVHSHVNRQSPSAHPLAVLPMAQLRHTLSQKFTLTLPPWQDQDKQKTAPAAGSFCRPAP